MKVFYVEKEMFLRQVIEQALQKQAHQVMTIDGIDDCLHFIEDFAPSLLLIDLLTCRDHLDQLSFLLKKVRENSQFGGQIILVEHHHLTVDLSQHKEIEQLIDQKITKPYRLSDIVVQLEALSSQPRGQFG